MMGQITRKKSSLCFLVILGAVAAVAEPGFHDDLETSLKAYFGEVLSNETTAAIAAESETKVEDDRWKRSPIYTAMNLPSYVADKYNGVKKLGATRARGQSYGKPEGYEKGNPSKDKYVMKGPVTGYKKKPLKEAEYSPPLKRRRPPYAGPKADKKYEAVPTYGGPMAPPAYKGPGTKTRPHQVGYGANKKARPVADGYGPSKRPKAKYVPSGKGQRKPAPYGPSNKSENYKQRPTYIRSRKPPQKKGPYRPRPQKNNYSGQNKCPYSGRCKKIQYRPGYTPSRPLPAYYKPKETEYGEQTPYDKGDAYEPSPYEKPTEMKPTYEQEQKEYETGNPYGPKPEYKPEYEAGESYQQPEPQYGAEEPKPEYGTVEPYRDQESSYRTPEPATEYNYDEPPPAQTPYDAQQGSEGGPVDYTTAQQEYEPPQESVAYGEPYPSTDTDTYQEQQQPIPDAEYSEPQQQQQQYETPVQNRPYEGTGYGDDPSQSYNQQVQEQDDVETDQYPASGSGYQEPSSVPTEGEGQDPDYGQPAQQQQYDDGSQYGPGPTNYEEQHQPEAPVYDLKNIAKQGPGKGRSGLYYGYNPYRYRYRAGYYHNPALTTDSLDSSDDSDDSDRRRRNRVSSSRSDSDDDSAADGDSTDVGSYY